MAEIIVDLESDVAGEQFAVVQTSRRRRKRFSEGCIRIMQTEQEARQTAATRRNEYAARVYGPSRSSEGLRIYYLIQWLDEEAVLK